ncbi:hypothetical protein COOONC_24818, partial [Cooperia oncophora]
RTSFRYALHVDSSRKTGTLKRRAARSQSQSSSRGGTPDAVNFRFNPRTEGFSIFCHLVRRLSSSSQDGTINWNVIRNQYRTRPPNHLPVKCRGSIRQPWISLRPASPFNPKTPSPTSSNSRSSQGKMSNIHLFLERAIDMNNTDSSQDSARRQHIVEQLRKNGVFVDENGRTVFPEESDPFPTKLSEPNDDELMASPASLCSSLTNVKFWCDGLGIRAERKLL